MGKTFSLPRAGGAGFNDSTHELSDDPFGGSDLTVDLDEWEVARLRSEMCLEAAVLAPVDEAFHAAADLTVRLDEWKLECLRQATSGYYDDVPTLVGIAAPRSLASGASARAPYLKPRDRPRRAVSACRKPPPPRGRAWRWIVAKLRGALQIWPASHGRSAALRVRS